MNIRKTIQTICIAVFCAGSLHAASQPPKARPNILFITCEDTNPHWGCYEGKPAATPAIDAIATKGVRYNNMFGISSVCAPNRTTIVSGMYPQTIAAHHMRCHTVFPENLKQFPQLLREKGYYCTNNYKQDYNLIETPKGTWDVSNKKAHWKNRKPGQPFYAVFNYIQTHEGFVTKEKNWKSHTRHLKQNERCNPADVSVPPMYPDTPEFQAYLARSYDNIRVFDKWVHRLIQEVKDAGLAEDTIIAIASDHGDGFPRMKRSLTDAGMRVPFVVYIPEKFHIKGQAVPGSAEDGLRSMVDIAPTFLNLCGVAAPEWMQGTAFLGPNPTAPRKYIYGGRDRIDEKYGLQRTIRDEHFRYTRNFRPDQPELNSTRATRLGDLWNALLRHQQEGTLSPRTAAWFSAPSELEGLYDVKIDPWELNNLADDPNYADIKKRLARELLNWQRDITDTGFIPEGMLEKIKHETGVYNAVRSAQYCDWPEASRKVAYELISPEKPSIEQMLKAAGSDCPPVRWWGVYALELYNAQTPEVEVRLKQLLEDSWGDIRVAAASALYGLGKAGDKAQTVITTDLFSENEGVRCMTANVVSKYADQMRPILPILKKACRQAGPGRAINNLINDAFRELGEPEIEWQSWKKDS